MGYFTCMKLISVGVPGSLSSSSPTLMSAFLLGTTVR